MTKVRLSSWILAVSLFGVIFLGGCGQSAEEATPSAPEEPIVAPAWMDIPLTNVMTGQEFKIGDFKGRLVFLQPFAKWDPTSLEQEEELQKLKQTEGDATVYVSLDIGAEGVGTGVADDEAMLKEFAEKHGFDWYFAIPPDELMDALIEDFGRGVASPRGVPLVLVCENQSTRFLGGGVKPVSKLLSELEKGCQ